MAFSILDYNANKHGHDVAKLWNRVLPQYHVLESHLIRLLADNRCKNYVAVGGDPEQETIQGFVTVFVFEQEKGYLSAIAVDPKKRNLGVGTSLLRKAQQYLLEEVGCKRIQVGSVFPRFWGGIPTDIPSKDFEFLIRKGYTFGGLEVKDLYIDLEGYCPPQPLLERASREGISFSPWTESGYKECMRLQRANFDNAEWVATYETLAQHGLHHQVMVAYEQDGSQVGWTLMIEPEMPVWKNFAFLPLLGERTALIGCVGIDSAARKRGIGHALVVHAMLDLQRRGMKRVFVDEVVLDDWYERLGFRAWRKYRQYEYRE